LPHAARPIVVRSTTGSIEQGFISGSSDYRRAATNTRARVKRKLPCLALCPSISGIVVPKHACFFASRTAGKTYPFPMSLLSSPCAAARDLPSAANQTPAAETHPATKVTVVSSTIASRVPSHMALPET
jgi:hypothetical protein